MIQRESYMRRIRPFIESDLVKVLTGMRRSGKSVMRELIREELLRRGASPDRIFSFNFEDMRLAPLLISAASLAKYFKNEHRRVAGETILNYLKYCTEAYLFYPAKRQDLRGKKVLSVNEKYYLADHGIREAIFGGNTRDIQQILENMVFLELLRRGYEVTVGKAGALEVDFVAEKRDRRLYVQVCYLLASEETIQREFGVYERIRDNFPKYVVSMDEIPMGRDGIHHCHIRDFLLDPSWSGETTRQ